MQQQELNTRAPRPETSEKYYKAKALIANGTALNDACAKVGMACATFRGFEEKHDPNPVERRHSKPVRDPNPVERRHSKPVRKPKQFLDIPMRHEETEDDKAVVIVCKTSQLKNILKGL